MNEMCHCGKHLHYTDKTIEATVRFMVTALGPEVTVVGPDGRKWLVPRHYIALHGLKSTELPDLGFEEVIA
jgi:hypothetical protein